jgi:hypothetical protein
MAVNIKDPNRFHLLRELNHAELVVFLELNRRSAATGSPKVRASFRELAEACSISTRSVQSAVYSLHCHRLIDVDNSRPKNFVLLYDLLLKLRRMEHKI